MSSQSQVLRRTGRIWLILTLILLTLALAEAGYMLSLVNESNLRRAAEDEIALLRAPSLHLVEAKWTDNRPQDSSPYIHIEGLVFNAGTEAALEVNIIVRIWGTGYVMIGEASLSLPDPIPGKGYLMFERDLPYSGKAESVTFDSSFSRSS